MLEATIHEETAAAFIRLQEKHKDIKEKLQKAYGYAVFPSVGRAGVVLGGAYGQGEVFEGGKPVGFATMSQITVGVQVGGQTFTQILTFGNQKSFENFKKRGKCVFRSIQHPIPALFGSLIRSEATHWFKYTKGAGSGGSFPHRF
ncbi:MAG: hypothetical protein GX556_19650, partial [Fibrobacter sp.]|nr:hypothetical protein [Fibrobacter sp.]